MTNKVKEEVANPYNKNKSWHSTGEDKAFVSSNSMFFEEPHAMMI